MKIIKPKKLQKGNKIGIVAVSGKIKEIERIENTKKFFEKEGYNVVISDTCASSHRYMAGRNDDECAAALNSFFVDKSINAILCARGGYGTLRLINKIDWKIIKNNPKIFAGYSDITILLNMIFKKTGLITFHSAMPNGDFGGEKIENHTKESFFNTLAGKTMSYNAQNGVVYNRGETQGLLWGGNLASLASLAGADFIPDTNLILFIEDLNEPVYKTDRMLTQLFNIRKIKKNVKGMVIGEFKNTDDENILNEVFYEFAENLNIPVRSGFRITHGRIKDTLPIGINVLFNAEKGLINILDFYTK